MKTLSVLLFPLLILTMQDSSCENTKQNDTTEQTISESAGTTETQKQNADNGNCIEERISFFKEERSALHVARIYTYQSKGETYYMFDEGMMVDAPAYVLNAECDTVCITGGVRMLNQNLKDCPPEEKDSRKMIWSKAKSND